MKRFLKSGLTLAVAMAGSLALTSPAHANLLLDGFGDEQPIGGSVTDSTTGDGPESSGTIQIFDTDFTNVFRTITAEMTTDTGGSANVTAQVIDGIYEHTQTAGENGYTQIDWTFDSSVFSDPVELLTQVTFIDQTAELFFTLRDGSGAESTQSALVMTEGASIHKFDGFSGLDLSDIVSASLEINGDASLDMNLDFIEVPAPGVLGLLGIGLAGIAFAARRRRSTEVAAV